MMQQPVYLVECCHIESRFLSAQVDDIMTAERPGQTSEETRGSQLEAFADKLKCAIWTIKTLKWLQTHRLIRLTFVLIRAVITNLCEWKYT